MSLSKSATYVRVALLLILYFNNFKIRNLNKELNIHTSLRYIAYKYGNNVLCTK